MGHVCKSMDVLSFFFRYVFYVTNHLKMYNSTVMALQKVRQQIEKQSFFCFSVFHLGSRNPTFLFWISVNARNDIFFSHLRFLFRCGIGSFKDHGISLDLAFQLNKLRNQFHVIRYG